MEHQTIIQGDCLQEMRQMADCSITHILTDPPYGLHFMGKDWDNFKKSNFDERGDHKVVPENGKDRGVRKIQSANSAAGTYDERRNDEFQEFMFKFGKEALRIVKPGGHILMFGAPRRFHRQICGLEDAGWEIRDCISWIFGSGFPKSHNKFGFDGYGTALKPAWEPILVCMKPLDGTFKQNAEKWGVAGINIDDCRIGTSECLGRENPKPSTFVAKINETYVDNTKGLGRWPANLILDEEAGELLDEQSGISKSPGKTTRGAGGQNGKLSPINAQGVVSCPSDSGGASRFFYCAKASSAERNAGLEGMDPSFVSDGRAVPNDTAYQRDQTPRKNTHPTIKPIKLMEYLLKLITPPNGGIVLDPFCGSGSTLVAARNLGINAIGIELQEEYCEIARKRIEYYPKKEGGEDATSK